MGRFGAILSQELGARDLRLGCAQALARMLPVMRFARLRTRLYRLGGLCIGRGTVILGRLRLTGEGRQSPLLRIGTACVINESITFNLGGRVDIGDHVAIGMQCLFVTVGHEMGDPRCRAGQTVTGSITVGSGAWLAARVVVLPGVTIGAGAVIAAGAVVACDVPPHTLAGGVPARVIRTLDTKGGVVV